MVGFPAADVLLTAHFQIDRTPLHLGLEDPFEKGNAPPATRAGSVAFCNLCWDLRMVQSDKLPDLLDRNMEANTDLIVILHRIGSLRVRGDPLGVRAPALGRWRPGSRLP